MASSTIELKYLKQYEHSNFNKIIPIKFFGFTYIYEHAYQIAQQIKEQLKPYLEENQDVWIEYPTLNKNTHNSDLMQPLLAYGIKYPRLEKDTRIYVVVVGDIKYRTKYSA